MCGICGFVTKETITLDQLKAMNDTMIHRGPDDSGEEIYMMRGGYSIGLGQRRLSIQDLSYLGHQPMHSPDGRITVIYNGEIYNYPQLREELSGYPFASSCDTEVILAGYQKWGIDMVSHLNGMFAIALYDRDEECLYLVRDRIGKKPLYYWIKNGNLVFASELKPIMSCPGFQKEIRADVIGRYLYQQCIAEPDSIFREVYKLQPGAILEFRKGEVRTRKYWDIAQLYHKLSADPVRSYEEAKEGLKERLLSSVKDRLISDVPLGTFLSGGYDSSMITAMAQSITDTPVKTFSIGFHDERYNEAAYAAAVAKHLGTDHTELIIDEDEMYRQVRSIPRYYDEPFADSSQIPSMLVAGLAKKDVTVVLSGDGGDEFFCGYNVYARLAQAQKLDPLGAALYRVTEPFHMTDKLPFKVKVIAANRDEAVKAQFGASEYTRRAAAMMANKEEMVPCHYAGEEHYGVKNWQIRRMLLDMETYLPADILAKVDRATMKYSLEGRCPILDREVMEYSFRIPHEYKYHRGDKKHILKDIAYDYIPRELLDRPKVGFSVPLDSWLRGPLREQLLDYSNIGYLKRQGLFDAEYVHKMIREYLTSGDGGPSTGANFSKLGWSFYVFQLWYQEYLGQ